MEPDLKADFNKWHQPKRKKRKITKPVWMQACRANMIPSSISHLSQAHHIKVCRLQLCAEGAGVLQSQI